MSEAFFFDSFLPATAFILLFGVPTAWLLVAEVRSRIARRERRGD